MEWLLYMVVSALLLEGLVLFVRRHSFHDSVIGALTKEIEDDDIVSFIALLMVYVIALSVYPHAVIVNT